MSIQETAALVRRLPVEVQEFILDLPADGSCSSCGALLQWLCARTPLITINQAKDGDWVVGLGRDGPVRWSKTLLESLALMVEAVVAQEKRRAEGGGAGDPV